MENVVLTIHLILALLLIGVVLLQRSEGGGLGMGSTGGVMSGRGAATALAKLTWIFAVAFIITSITLTLIAAKNASDSSVVQQIGGKAPAPAPAADPAAPLDSGSLLPPTSGDAPVAPPAIDAPVTPPATPAAPETPAAPAAPATPPAAPAN
jgi:preprotein translocase subunit SecG